MGAGGVSVVVDAHDAVTTLTPPKAPGKASTREFHGDVFVDHYEWLRDKSDLCCCFRSVLQRHTLIVQAGAHAAEGCCSSDHKQGS